MPEHDAERLEIDAPAVEAGRETFGAATLARASFAGRAAALAGGRISPADATILQRVAGNRSVAAALATGRRVLARLGKPLDVDLTDEDPVPVHGEDKGEQRRYSRPQFETMWEAEQGRKLQPQERLTIMKGCVGITMNNAGPKGVGNILGEVYASLSKAQEAADAYNAGLPRYESQPYQVFAMHFWSNQDDDPEKRKVPDPSAFLPDADGKVDMSKYKANARPGFVNFDFGWWDEASQSYWHANHADPMHPNIIKRKVKLDGPMKVYQSTREKFSQVLEEEPGQIRYGYKDFDREVFGVVRATNYDPSRGTHPKLKSPRFYDAKGKPDAGIERVFKGKAKLQAGSPSSSVRIVQQMLVDQNYDLGEYGPAKDGVDGRYGKKTADAVKRFKSDENLPAPDAGTVERPVILCLDDMYAP